ncbi:hypothetical protein ESY86_19475 [Subsaximicrobium wynnwilliamsii]|uniref:Uncharacterized protein n=1 Tax=Subsaximicrobium wynnwilliamsii TaxID=291179 RepID=A0A5C6ZCH7_9FLAO|nr:hypothetical protein [Subsaximicrobium wynnwilliamsii]TXD86722.1 hypothetical protein ESY86_19475 [Subsaximicrobium wynnwilliamsii]
MNFTSRLCYRLFLPILIFGSLQMYSQTANTDFANQINTVFQNFDKNRLAHGFLSDFGLDFT